jgi:hypothetical protein
MIAAVGAKGNGLTDGGKEFESMSIVEILVEVTVVFFYVRDYQ